jgi:uncharacterized protein YprB with RNaseH-like and TPR domain
MPSISDKLRELGVHLGTADLAKSPPKKNSPKLVDLFDGCWESYSRGDCFVLRKTIPLNYQHGSHDLSAFSFPAINSRLLIRSEGPQISRDRILFIDTETTGLSGGAGSYIFLIGAARFEANALHLAQFFLQDPSSEPAQLEALEGFSASTELVVSYNGKSFDLPRINARYALHRWVTPFKDVLHIDLLHIARRLWRDHLPGCTLGDLEQHLLRFKRTDEDVPGWQVAEMFYDYLHTGDPSPLTSVFYHNEMDVISLASLLDYIHHRIAEPLEPSFSDQPDLVSIADYLLSLGSQGLALEVFDQAFRSNSVTAESRISGMLSLASYYKKAGDYLAALPLWEGCAQAGDHRAMIELAKYHEHRSSDLQESIHWTLTALDSYTSQKSSLDRDRLIAEAEHRLDRLKAKTSGK